jgi:hypothetical protein
LEKQNHPKPREAKASIKQFDTIIAPLDLSVDKTEIEYLKDYIKSAGLDATQAKSVLDVFAKVAMDPEAIDEALNTVDEMAKKADYLKVAKKCIERFKKLKENKNNSKLNVNDRALFAQLAKPNFYSLPYEDLVELANMMDDMLATKLGGKTDSKFTDAEVDAAFNAATKPRKKKPRTRGIRQKKDDEFYKDVAAYVGEFAGSLPEAKLLSQSDLSLLSKPTLFKVINALRTYDQIGEVYGLGRIAQEAWAKTNLKGLNKTEILAFFKKESMAVIANMLASDGSDATAIRAKTLGPFEREITKSETQIKEERNDIDKKLIELGVKDTKDFFDLGTYMFFRENTPGQSSKFKAKRMAGYMNQLHRSIQGARSTASDANRVAQLKDYYKHSIASLKKFGVITGEDGKWEASDNFTLKPDSKILAAADFLNENW